MSITERKTSLITIIAALLCFAITSCWYYSFTDVAYSHIKSTHISPFENETSEYELEIILNEKVVNAVVGGHLFSIESEEKADSRIQGTITSFTRSAYTYDQQEEVNDYIIRIMVRISFYDKINKKQLWEKTFEGWGTYPAGGDDSEAVESALEMVGDKIIEQLQS
ncbi:hypothetical protein JXI42_12125 [bacterium]|nr:hypothetical protein [bacterium]